MRICYARNSRGRAIFFSFVIQKNMWKGEGRNSSCRSISEGPNCLSDATLVKKFISSEFLQQQQNLHGNQMAFWTQWHLKHIPPSGLAICKSYCGKGSIPNKAVVGHRQHILDNSLWVKVGFMLEETVGRYSASLRNSHRFAWSWHFDGRGNI